ncbi:MAG: RtcB family protein, partial [Clostridiaceae bacterium]|nr:RtcB family protein [Clostridiaceae bacterium]
MFIYENHMENEKDRPIKVWLSSLDDIEERCLQQAINIAKLPFIHSHVALMPDTHAGYGMPIGGVVATRDTIVPNMVGVDIGCGMCFVQTNIPVSLLRETMTSSGTLLQAIIGTILRNVPTGFAHHKLPQSSISLDIFKTEIEEKSIVKMAYDLAKDLQFEVENGYYQIGTLGGGNHFIELQEDENGMTAIMLHSGSRNFGYKICNYFNNLAKELNKGQEGEKDLAYLSLESDEGIAYKVWMDLALDFAMENRSKMMVKVKEIFYNLVKKHTDFNHLEETMEVNAHHNYAVMEKHFNEDVIVHRKGAIKVAAGELGIIPGAMGSYSYIV